MFNLSATLEELIKYWYYPLTIFSLDALLITVLFYLFGIYLSTGIFSLLLVVVITGFWYKTRSLPSNQGAIGILLAIRSESTVDREKFENDFVGVLKKGVSNNFKGLETRLYPVHQYYCEKIDQHTSRDYLFKTNCHICIYGSIKLRDEEDGKKYYLDLDCVVRHRKTSEEVQGQFIEELNELKPPSNLSLDVKNEVVSFLVISEWLRIYILYNLVIASVISNDYKTAQDLLDYLNTILSNTKLEHPVIQKIQNRIVFRQLDIYHLMLSIFYAKWRNTREEEYFIRIKNVCKKALALNRGLTRFNISIAISEIVLNNDLDKATKIFLKFRKVDVVKLNLAFILCLKGEHKRTHEYYKEADFENISVDQINQVEEFAEWYLNKNQMDSLYLVLALINLYGKGDYKRAKEDYNSFFEYCRKSGVKIDDSILDDLKNKIQAGLD